MIPRMSLLRSEGSGGSIYHNKQLFLMSPHGFMVFERVLMGSNLHNKQLLFSCLLPEMSHKWFKTRDVLMTLKWSCRGQEVYTRVPEGSEGF